MATNDRFRARMAQRIKTAKSKHDLFGQKLSVELLSRMVMRSPVDTGRFRGNWNVSLSSPDLSTDQSTDPSGGSTITKGAAIISGLVVNGQTIYITNSLPYAYRLETGYSQQAPAGIVGLTVVEFSSIAKQVGAEVRML